MSFHASAQNGQKPRESRHCSSFEEVAQTSATVDDIKETTLSYARLGIRFREINVFWCPLLNIGTSLRKSVDGSSRRCFRPTIDEETNNDADLPSARPPDGYLGLPVWRDCHMGVILKGHAGDMSEKDAQLILAIDLYPDGIHMKQSFGPASRSRSDVIQELKRNYDEDHPFFSAGVTEEIDIELKALLDVVESFKRLPYSAVTFNCQRFTSILYYKFTKKSLRDLLRHRWTSNSNSWGCREDRIDEEAMSWARGSSLLMQELKPVEGEPLLFCRSPRGFGKACQAGVASGAALATSRPVLGLVLVAGSIIIDKIPQIRRFARSTIWFKYDGARADWFWSPYRDGEVDPVDRWIAVHELNVKQGHFEGCELEGTARRIVAVLSNNIFSPLVNNEEECPICLELTPQSNFVAGSNCSHVICKACFVQVEDCPFCRASF